jgi:hypothetical protein
MKENKKAAPGQSNGGNQKQFKDKHFSAQMKRVFTAFAVQPKTMKMVSIETGIDRANVCRYCAKFRKAGQLRFIGFGLCKITKHRAGYLLTTKTPMSCK